MATEPEPRPTITKVWAKNFRSIEYAELELGPLTVLVGPNASGKSNLLDVLGFLADAARHRPGDSYFTARRYRFNWPQVS